MNTPAELPLRPAHVRLVGVPLTAPAGTVLQVACGHCQAQQGIRGPILLDQATDRIKAFTAAHQGCPATVAA